MSKMIKMRKMSKMQVRSKLPLKWSKIFRYCGPGLLVAVGYMDPGNWATDIAAGSQYGYQLLFVILLSNWAAIFLQILAVRLGLQTNKDLARACRDYYPRSISVILWLLCEIAIIACDVAEVLGAAIALRLLFNLPMLLGVCLIALDVLIILALQGKSITLAEIITTLLIIIIGICFIVEIFLAKPVWPEVMQGLIPSSALLQDRDMLYLAIGIMGATVMPHNLYLHSAIVRRQPDNTIESQEDDFRYNIIGVALSLSVAFFINAAILVLASAAFHRAGLHDVTEITSAFYLLPSLLGAPLASILFATALLLAGQNATLTGTLAGQIVMEGFMDWHIKPWQRRLFTRILAIIPAVAITALYGSKGSGQLLIFSQVVLSLQLPFAIFPLILFTSNPKIMGSKSNSFWMRISAWAIGVIITGLNIWMICQFVWNRRN